MFAIQTDSEAFPFDTEAMLMLQQEGIDLIKMEGHSPEIFNSMARDASIVFHYLGPITASIISGMGECRVIARMGMGFDSIDVRAARDRGIEVVYVPDFATDDVADHALALILACSRKIRQQADCVRNGGWPSYEQLAPIRTLTGSTLGILGLGRIGRAVAARAAAFGMRVVACDPYMSSEMYAAVGAERLELTALFDVADFISIHLPLTESTDGLVGASLMGRMQRHSYLINTSRGSIVDQAALVAALEQESIAGAGLDVFDGEPLPLDDPLRSFAQVIVSPHSASFSVEALAEARHTAIQDSLRVVRGEAPVHRVPGPP